LEEETIEVTFESKSIQLKTMKNSSTSWTGALASEHPMLGGRTDALSVYLLWMKAEIKSSTGWTDGQKISTGALDVPCSREYILVDFNFSSAPVEPTLQNQSTGALDVLCSRELVCVDQWNSSAPVEPMPLRSMHRCNDTSLDTVSEHQWLQFGHRETGWTDASNLTPIGSSGAHGFSAVDFQRLCNSFHSI